MKVQDPDKRFVEVVADWALIDALYGGTKTMRAAGEVYLPRETAEQQLQYDNRLKRSFLYGALRNTITKVVAKPFTKPVIIEGGTETTQGLDDQTRFARLLFADAVKYNEAFFLVELPKTEEGLSLAEEKSVQPYFVRIEPRDMLEASAKMLRYKYIAEVPDAPYGTKDVERIRVMTATTFEVHEYIANTWVKIEDGTHTFGSIPLVQIKLEETLPFEDLAYMNLAHWQSNSDQRNILRFARMPLLYQFGVSLEEAEKPIVFGPAQVIRSTNADAKMGFVEHSGKAIEAGDRDLQNLEAQMEILGLQPMLRKQSGNATATAKTIDEGKQQTSVQAWANVLETGLQEGNEFALEWKNETADVKVRVHTDFALSMKADTDIKELREMYKVGAITAKTYLFEVKRRGFFDEDFDVETEAALIDTGDA